MAPALRLGVERLVLVALRYAGSPQRKPDALPEYPSPLFLVGKVLNALLLDPVDYDLQVLERLNRVLEVLEETVTPDQLARVMGVLEEERGMAYKRVRTLVFRPSEDIGVLAGRHLREARHGIRLRSRLTSALLRHASAIGHSVETDLGSFLLFDGGYASALIDLGRRDARARAAEIRAFFPAM
jgi:NTE family protein